MIARASLTVGFVLIAAMAFAAPLDRLLDVLSSDDSYKVRMKAIRLISKRVLKDKVPPSQAVMTGLGLAATKDDNYLVRGMACVALGQIHDPRGRLVLEAAVSDDEAFVRAQAESALEKMTPVPTRVGDLIVVATDRFPNVQLPQLLQDDLLGFLWDELSSHATGFKVAKEGSEPGYQLTATVASFEQTPIDGGRVAVTVEVKLTVATWPQKNLRHVMTAKASAKVQASQDNLRIQRKVLRAAVQRTVKEALQEIGGPQG
jgi:hypothetical protein